MLRSLPCPPLPLLPRPRPAKRPRPPRVSLGCFFFFGLHGFSCRFPTPFNGRRMKLNVRLLPKGKKKNTKSKKGTSKTFSRSFPFVARCLVGFRILFVLLFFPSDPSIASFRIFSMAVPVRASQICSNTNCSSFSFVQIEKKSS